MRIFTAFILLFSIFTASSTAQELPDGISYQAVALDENGKEVVNNPVAIRFSILEGSAQAEDPLYQETHSVLTDSYGLFSVVIGQGTFEQGEHTSLSTIAWHERSIYLKVEIDLTSSGTFRLMGVQQMMSVPFAMHAASAESYSMQAGSWHNPDNAIFRVQNTKGEIVFSVNHSGVEIIIDDDSKGSRSGFAVGGFSRSKEGEFNEYLRVDPGYVQVSVQDPTDKGSRGGFAVGGFSSRKSDIPDYFTLQSTMAEFILDEELSKGSRSGFAVGGFSSLKGNTTTEYLMAGYDSIRIFIDVDPGEKGSRGGFAVGGFSSRKTADPVEFIRIDPGFTRFAIDPDITENKGSRGGFAVGGFSSRKGDTDYFSLTPDSARFYIDTDYAKGSRSGFAVGGFSSLKGDHFADYINITADSTRVGITGDAKGTRGGFAVSSRGGGKGIYQDILYTTPQITEIYTKDGGAKFLGGFTVFSLNNLLQEFDLFKVTEEVTTVTGTFAVVATVITTPVTEIDTLWAIAGGNVISDNDYEVTGRGLVWGRKPGPRVSANEGMTEEGAGMGEFTSTMTNLRPGATYFVRAYATNIAGTAYGEELSFTALGDYVQIGNLTGQVTDAVNGLPVEGAEVSIGGLTVITDLNGYYFVEDVSLADLRADFYSNPTEGPVALTVNFYDLSTDDTSPPVFCSKSGYNTYINDQVVMLEDKTITLNISLSPVLSQGELRFVLTWGETPYDLDAHLETPEIDGQKYVVYYGNPGSPTTPPYANLDYDVTSGFGPETITIYNIFAGTYHYYIYNFSNEPDIITSESTVKIYDDSGLRHTVNIPQTGSGLYWYVCDVDGSTGQITIVNTIEETQPGSGYYDGGYDEGYKSGMPGKIKDSDSKAFSWLWNFGDETTSTEQNPVKVYQSPGLYTVSLTVTTGDESDTRIKTNYIKVSDTTQIDNVTDIDGNIYQTVTIGTQVWMAENLKTTRYRNGNQIADPGVMDWTLFSSEGSYIVYDHSLPEAEGINTPEEMIDNYGLLYSFGTVHNSSGLCPAGWFVPTFEDFLTLVESVGGQLDGALKLKSARTVPDPHPRWIAPNTGTTGDSGFEGLPGGQFYTDNYEITEFNSLGEYGFWLTSTTLADFPDEYYGYKKGDKNIRENKSSKEMIEGEEGGFYVTMSTHSAETDYNLDYHGYSASSVRCKYGFGMPRVKNISILEPGLNSAIVKGFVIDDGGMELSAVGVIWSTEPGPVLGTHQGISQSETPAFGEFTSELTGLNPNTTYYTRAFATTAEGKTGYGESTPLTTFFGTVPDNDGNIYYSIMVGDQLWMAENLRTTTYNNGTGIVTGLDDTQWHNSVDGAYTIYPHTAVEGINSDAGMLAAYGALYNWHALATGNLCPAGWRVPSDEDFIQMEIYIGMDPEAAGFTGWRGINEAWKLKSTRTEPDDHPRWGMGNSAATNQSGFSALPGGERSASGFYNGLGYDAYWWTATDYSNGAWFRQIEDGYGDIQRGFDKLDGLDIKNAGYSVRCIEGEAPEIEFGGGSGTELDPYLILTAEHLNNVRFASGAYFRQEADISLAEQPFISPELGWEPIGTEANPFTGNYNGQGFSITDLWINRESTDNVGLFGYASEAEIHDLVIDLVVANVTGNNSVGILLGFGSNTTVGSVHVTGQIFGNDWVGGIAGRNTGETGSIGQSSASVEVTGTGIYTGGLIGFSDGSAVVSECYSRGSVNGDYAVGGLVGWHGGGSVINNSYSTAMASGNSEIGGLVGRNDGAIMYSYSTGPATGELGVGGLVGYTEWEIGYLADSYWDTESSGLTFNDGGQGKVTILMTLEATFEGWDFLTTWSVLEEVTYPYLQWQVEPGDHNYADYLGDQTVMGSGVTDIEGNFYETVIIGEQEWMAENLRTTTYNTNIEAFITHLPGDVDWQFAEGGAYSVYNHELVAGIDNEIQMIDAYGMLYNWFAVETGELCPVGWRVPTAYDWEKLTEYLDNNYEKLNSTNIGNALKDCRQEGSPLGGECDTPNHPRWNNHPAQFGTDIFGFSALPGGRRSGLGTYFDQGNQGNWWSWTESSEFNAASRIINVGGGSLNSASSDKYAGFSVRCIKSDGIIEQANVITSIPDSIGYYDAILSGTVEELNGESAIGRGFYWGTDPLFMEERTYNGSGPGPFTADLFGRLRPETTYYYTAYAHNESGYSYGDTLSFTTLALTEAYIHDFAGDLFLKYWQVLKSYNIGMTAHAAADQTTVSWGNWAWKDMSEEPRTEWDNHPNYPYEWVTGELWIGFDRIILRSNDALEAILINGMDINGGADNDKVLATLYLMKGLATGQLGMVFDQAYIKNYFDTGEPFLSNWSEVILAGISDLETAINISINAAQAFSWGTEVMPGHDVTSTFMSQLANSHAARFLAQGSRNSWDNESLSWAIESYTWADVYAFADQGLTVDFAPVGDGLPWEGGTWWDLNIFYLRQPGWGRVDMRVINLLDPDAPVRYPTDENGLPLEPPQIHAELQPGQSQSLDQRFYTDYEFLPDNTFMPDRGGWHFSHYRHSRYDNDMGISVGPMYEFRVYENELIKAEALLRGFEDATGAAAILNDVNNPRIARGNLDPVNEFDGVAVMDAIFYERYTELFHNGWMIHFHDMRRTDYLQYGTPLHFPVPGKILEESGFTPYTFGGFTNADGINTSNGGEWIQPFYHFEFGTPVVMKSASKVYDENEDYVNRHEYYENNTPLRIEIKE